MAEKELFSNLYQIRDLVLKYSQMDIMHAEDNDHVLRMILKTLQKLDKLVESLAKEKVTAKLKAVKD